MNRERLAQGLNAIEDYETAMTVLEFLNDVDPTYLWVAEQFVCHKCDGYGHPSSECYWS